MKKILIDELFVDETAVILTPNRRLAATITARYNEKQLKNKRLCWNGLSILPFVSWVESLWRAESISSSSRPTLLSQEQELQVWQDIILSSAYSENLLQPEKTVETAISAWRLMKAWRIPATHPLLKKDKLHIALTEWVDAFNEKCQRQNWLDKASLLDWLVGNANLKLESPKKVILVGFNDLSPQQTYFFVELSKLGVDVTMRQLDMPNHHSSRIVLEDEESELQAMAAFAKKNWLENSKNTIACVIPGLDKKRDRVWQIFAETFAANNTYTIDKETAPFTVSAGKPLADYPIIQAALKCFQFHNKLLPIDFFTDIVQSPFLVDGEKERIKRTKLIARLKKKNISVVDTQKDLEKYAPTLHKAIATFHDYLDSLDKTHSYSAWAQHLNHLLELLGWPGERNINNEEHQAVEAWLKVLNTYSTLDYVSEQATISEAIKKLDKLCRKTMFQLRTNDANIQVLGLSEASSIPFDKVWIAGMDDLSWPPQPKPNSLLPKRLQREEKMPHATAELELNYCTQITEQFKQYSSHIIFSYAAKKDNLDVQASPLIQSLSGTSLAELGIKLHNGTVLERSVDYLDDFVAPSVNIDDTALGGVDIIKKQAACPFKAFSEWRLHAHNIDEPLPGLRAMDRGNIVHAILEKFWLRVKSQDVLLKLTTDDLNKTIDTAIDEALSERPLPQNRLPQYLSLEKKRLAKLINEWLDGEKTREPFTLHSQEAAAKINIGKLKFNVRIDRIDQLEDGTKLIIDYKTGQNNEIGYWLTERPDEPQLPIYAMLDPDNTIGITFAQVYPGKCHFSGLSAVDVNIKGIKDIKRVKKIEADNWVTQIKNWQQTFEQLANDYCDGDARVDPKDGDQTCTWCQLKPLCRVNEEIEANDS